MIPKVQIIENIKNNEDVKFVVQLQFNDFQCLFKTEAPRIKVENGEIIDGYFGHPSIGVYLNEDKDYCFIFLSYEEGVYGEGVDFLIEYLHPFQLLIKSAREWIKKQKQIAKENNLKHV